MLQIVCFLQPSIKRFSLSKCSLQLSSCQWSEGSLCPHFGRRQASGYACAKVVSTAVFLVWRVLVINITLFPNREYRSARKLISLISSSIGIQIWENHLLSVPSFRSLSLKPCSRPSIFPVIPSTTLLLLSSFFCPHTLRKTGGGMTATAVARLVCHHVGGLPVLLVTPLLLAMALVLEAAAGGEEKEA